MSTTPNAYLTTMLPDYLNQFDTLINDKRTRTTFHEIIAGIITSGSLCCQRIAAHAPGLASLKDGAKRVKRLVHGTSTKRSKINDADALIERVREYGIERLSDTDRDDSDDTNDLWVIADGSDLRKPHAQAMPDMMKVRALDGKKLVPGYRTLNTIGVTPQQRGLLYHRLFSSKEDDFRSESLEVRTMVTTVETAMQSLKQHKAVTWILDSGFDDVAHWRTIWEHDSHLVCRVHHRKRLVSYQDAHGTWHEGKIDDACAHMRSLALVETDIEGTSMEPWLLITDWPVTDETSALRIFRMYRQRWAIEDSFKFLKEMLGWETVQLLDLEAIRELLALAWVAAGFLYELGVSLEWPEVRLLARLGGWVEREDQPPGRVVITRGLQRLIDLLATIAALQAEREQRGELPPRIAEVIADMLPQE